MVLATAGVRRVDAATGNTRTANGTTNVGEMERVLSVAAGTALAVQGIRRRGLEGIALALLGTELVRRGATGRCMLYEKLGVSSTGDGRLGTLPHRADGADGVTGAAATVNARRAIKVERAITIAQPAADLYAFWRDFQNLPRIMRYVESVRVIDAMRSHWVARLAGGRRVEWDAEIVNDLPDQLIAWKTVGDPDVAHAGSVHFRDLGGGRTEVRVVMDYEPPMMGLLAGTARLLGVAPEDMVDGDLRRLKELAEGAGAG